MGEVKYFKWHSTVYNLYLFTQTHSEIMRVAQVCKCTCRGSWHFSQVNCQIYNMPTDAILWICTHRLTKKAFYRFVDRLVGKVDVQMADTIAAKHLRGSLVAV